MKEERENKAADAESIENLLAIGQMENIAAGGFASDPVDLTHKFGLPLLPIPARSQMKNRYEPIVTQITNLLMRDGKKSVAQRVGPSLCSTWKLTRR
jgi:small subunit ribosomal protein S7